MDKETCFCCFLYQRMKNLLLSSQFSNMVAAVYSSPSAATKLLFHFLVKTSTSSAIKPTTTHLHLHLLHSRHFSNYPKKSCSSSSTLTLAALGFSHHTEHPHPKNPNLRTTTTSGGGGGSTQFDSPSPKLRASNKPSSSKPQLQNRAPHFPTAAAAGSTFIDFSSPKRRTLKKPTLRKSLLETKTQRHIDVENAPFAAESFSDLRLSLPLLHRLENEALIAPTDVQSTAIPAILDGHDVIIQSFTGSGKTLAYLLPVLSQVGPLKDKGNSGGGDGKSGIEAVIVAPSRELGMQIVREAEKILGQDQKKAVQQLVGGANRSRQEEALKKNKPLIVVGTPGRIAEISIAGKLHTHDCRFLVLDEVDQLLSSNFREDMHRILEHVGRKSGRFPAESGVGRQTILVSATVPFSVLRAATSWCRDPLIIRAKTISSLDEIEGTSATGVKAADSLPPSLMHYYSVVKGQHKVDAMRRCIHAIDAKRVICFMNNSKQLKDTVFKLDARGIRAAELHGELGKLGRSTVLKEFRNGEIRVLVTNELSARGLDVAECDLVVNLELPTDAVHYAHRAGRTGRLGRKGTVVTVCEESEVFVVRKMRKQLGVEIAACQFADGKLIVCSDREDDHGQVQALAL